MAKHFLHNSKTTKVKKMIFFGHQNVQITGVNLAKSVDFCVHFLSKSTKIASLATKKFAKIVPPNS